MPSVITMTFGRYYPYLQDRKLKFWHAKYAFLKPDARIRGWPVERSELFATVTLYLHLGNVRVIQPVDCREYFARKYYGDRFPVAQWCERMQLFIWILFSFTTNYECAWSHELLSEVAALKVWCKNLLILGSVFWLGWPKIPTPMLFLGLHA